MDGQMVDVLVVGAGPVGLTLACALADNGVSVRIVDKRDEWSRLSKAMTLTPRTLECFHMLGVARRCLADGILSQRMHHHTERGRTIAVTDLAELDGAYPGLLHLSQHQTITILVDALAERGVTVERGVELRDLHAVDDHYVGTVAEAGGGAGTVAARFVVGTDGSHSRVRETLGLRFDGAEQDETFIMADIEMTGHLPDPEDRHAYYLDEGTTLFILPIDGRSFRLVSTCRTPATEADEDFVLRRFRTLLRTVGLDRITLGDPFWVTRFNPRQFLADDFRRDGVFLAGDAAHVQSPIGAQGLNTGIQDAINLAWKLGQVVRGESDAASLDSYHAERYPVARQLFAYNNLIAERVFGRNRLKRRLLRYQNYLLRLPRWHARELDKVSQFRVGYPAAQTPGSPLRAGLRMPDCDLVTLDGERFDLLREAGARRHVALLFADRAEPAVTLPGGIAAFVVHERTTPHQRHRRPADQRALVDVAGRWRRRVGLQPGSTVLVRPDGHVAAVATPESREALDSYLRVFRSTPLGTVSSSRRSARSAA
ncbi:2-polyprenyl-6-methoxyphenol hydroxylase-like FAD-dependent oxidoreductase [Actinoplanes octamycinicus]|uniref:2-polyprenyl-6-methoxyphenol hydroxylase-like FAD-dependent oxidoreductase n=1 Tax=Actinoplanes octamycinicus TaxID=135948 RepID=A0A7W7GVF3_9ACTN|nr:FAD-dependent monooxygenase [Actinoplanes octamycinicus]MBB4739055.1 2-polyprenyl-6-methoxyphenol hydroxylase-like FAD-dependent oxidoreductase [Actinoplanes octamycinicus]GIE60186.1 3-(3-hydroxyphenyl)propionate hydroxylase [Actinoplanes octamycinicus]